MILENIKNFDWINEPQNVHFVDRGLIIETKPRTDFWQSADYNFFKDDGHLFALGYDGNFTITAKWYFAQIKDSAQCGIMVRFDERNWIKAGLLSPNPYLPQLGVVTANQGASDWSNVTLPTDICNLWLRIKRRGNDFIVYSSVDGQKFEQIRMAHLSQMGRIVAAGAYACSPKDENFECVLEDIDIRPL